MEPVRLGPCGDGSRDQPIPRFCQVGPATPAWGPAQPHPDRPERRCGEREAAAQSSGFRGPGTGRSATSRAARRSLRRAGSSGAELGLQGPGDRPLSHILSGPSVVAASGKQRRRARASGARGQAAQPHPERPEGRCGEREAAAQSSGFRGPGTGRSATSRAARASLRRAGSSGAELGLQGPGDRPLSRRPGRRTRCRRPRRRPRPRGAPPRPGDAPCPSAPSASSGPARPRTRPASGRCSPRPRA